MNPSHRHPKPPCNCNPRTTVSLAILVLFSFVLVAALRRPDIVTLDRLLPVLVTLATLALSISRQS